MARSAYLRQLALCPDADTSAWVEHNVHLMQAPLYNLQPPPLQLQQRFIQALPGPDHPLPVAGDYQGCVMVWLGFFFCTQWDGDC